MGRGECVCEFSQSTFQNSGLQGLQNKQECILAVSREQSFLGTRNEESKAGVQKGEGHVSKDKGIACEELEILWGINE